MRGAEVGEIQAAGAEPAAMLRAAGTQPVARLRAAAPKPLAALLALGLCAVLPAVTHAAVHAHATRLGPAPSRQMLSVVLPLRADDAGLQAFATAVSTPGSPLYGAYEPLPILAERFGASPAVRRQAVAYLRSIGARQVRVDATGMEVDAVLSVSVAERAFGTPLDTWRGADGADYVAPAAGAQTAAAAALPRGLAGVALGVVGLDTARILPRPPVVRAHGGHGSRGSAGARAHGAVAQPPSDYTTPTGTPHGCGGALATNGFTPSQYLTAYDYDPLHQAGFNGQGERVAVIEIDGVRGSDLVHFANCFHLHLPPISIYGLGSRHPLAPGIETTLDLEVLTAAAPDLNRLEVFETNGTAEQVVQAFVAPLFVPGAKPQVISASLGLCEPDMIQAFGRAGILSTERALSLAAATGITVLAASGDNGSATCSDNNGNVVPKLAVNYPASSAWVTGVGGTNFMLDAANHITQQVVWNDTIDQLAGGGGGVSKLFATPKWQRSTVAGKHREVPDVALLADVAPGYAIYCTAAEQGCTGWTTVGGTSAATPLLAGGLALVDQDLRRNGREELGFVNPLLYTVGRSTAEATVFSDVTAIGNDVGPYIPGNSRRLLGCCTAGPRYDDASGWGSVDLGALDRYSMANLPLFGHLSMSLPPHQHPLRHHGIAVKLTCSTDCGHAYAVAFIGITHGPDLTVQSAGVRLTAGSRRVSLHFSRAEENAMLSALRKHHTIQVEIFGAAANLQGQLVTVTAGAVLKISS